MKKPKSVILKQSIRFSVFVSILLIAGCQTYRPMPLNKESVSKGLQSPDWEKLKVEAGKIQHPILQPVELNLRDGLSPDEAAVIAVLVNPGLKAARDERSIAAGQVMDAGLLPNPTLSYSMDFPIGGNTEDTLNAYGLGVDWDITDLISRRVRMKSASSTKKSVELDIAWQEWQVAEGAKMAVYDILLLESQLSTALKMEQALKENLDRMNKAFEKEFITRTELSETEIALQNSHSQVLELQQEIEKQKLLLNRALGVPPETHFTLQSDSSMNDSWQTPKPEDLIKGLEKRRLDLLALKKGYESQEENLHQAVLEQFPKINLGVNTQRDTGDVKTVGYGVSIDIPFFNHSQGQIAIANATRKQLYDEYISRVFEARSDIYEVTADIYSLKEQIHYEEQGIQKIQKLVDSYKKALAQENIDILSYYNARNDLFDKKLNVIKLQQELQDLHIALEISAGEYLKEK